MMLHSRKASDTLGKVSLLRHPASSQGTQPCTLCGKHGYNPHLVKKPPSPQVRKAQDRWRSNSTQVRWMISWPQLILQRLTRCLLRTQSHDKSPLEYPLF